MLLKKNKQSILFLKNEFGIGTHRAFLLLTLCGFNLNFNCKYKKLLKLRLIKRIKNFIFIKNWFIKDRLKYRRQQYFIFIKLLQNYKFFRFKCGLPVRGQRTHSNRQNNYKFSSVVGLLKLSSIKLSKKKKLKMIVRSIKYKKPVKLIKNISVKKKKHFIVLG